ncbi:tyrosine-protein phosphatase [Sorangium sp. So ce887]|uniref:tyrosine-protein phosphatase n=1 Tax=Sorangium sp. So ce887 TaxID=3133324 RepID=UPI003F60EDF0
MTPVKAMHSEVVYHFENVSNFRDLGGVKTADGHTFRTGVLFRSDELSRMSPQDRVKLQDFNIKVICDLRSPRESQKKPPRLANKSIQVVNIPLVEQATEDALFRRSKMLSFLFSRTGGDEYLDFTRSFYHHLAFEQTSRIREVITLLSKEDSLPALIHCTMGKDRTGFLAAVIQLLVGVPYQTVVEEYLRTNDYLAPRWEKVVKVTRVLTLFQVPTERVRLMIMAYPDFLHEVHDRIVEKYGSFERYLCEACEIDRGTQQRLKDRLLA